VKFRFHDKWAKVLWYFISTINVLKTSYRESCFKNFRATLYYLWKQSDMKDINYLRVASNTERWDEWHSRDHIIRERRGEGERLGDERKKRRREHTEREKNIWRKVREIKGDINIGLYGLKGRLMDRRREFR
jgi:hypothetical protein